MKLKPSTIEEVQTAVRNATTILPRGGGTKPALSTPVSKAEGIDLSELAGMLEYQPEEYTFTALAGTRVAAVQRVLAERGQYLPFDPILAKKGATLGGTVAAGLSGPGRYHYGGVRDFLLGVCFVNSQGQLVRGGGKVVKNAAGFDLPKLMVGSLGSLGVMVELTFKVFPKPATFITLRRRYPDLEQALKGKQGAVSARLDIDALELLPLSEGYDLLIRMGGLEKALLARVNRLEKALDGCQMLESLEQDQVWEGLREFTWVPDGYTLIKAPITPGKIPAVETALSDRPIFRHYSAGGQLVWLAMEGHPASLEDFFRQHGLIGLVLWGPAGAPRLGERKGHAFYQRIKSALDPEHHFVEA
jgi:glycolate oxidase FAD binding subunit